MVAYKQQSVFLTVVESGKSKIKVLADVVCRKEGPLCGSQPAIFSLDPPVLEGGGSSQVLCMRALIPS